MKKAAILICIAMALLFLCACHDGSPAEAPEDSSSAERVITHTKNCKITEITDDKNFIKYLYEVTDKNGNVMEQAYCAQQPRAAQVSDSLLGVRFTLEGHTFVRYYDLEKGIISRTFKNPFWGNDTLVATHDYDNDTGHYFEVQDIFNEDGYYFRKDIVCSSIQITVTATQESTDGKSIYIKYVPGDGSNKHAYASTVSVPIVPAE